VFAVNTDGTGFTTLHNFTGSDGASPYAGLVLSGSTLYRTASAGGSTGGGTVFAVNTDGTGFTALHSFTGSDGIEPNAGLILSGNTLYGTAFLGGSAGNGTVFAVNTDGTGFTNLHSFTAFSGSVCCVNSDGAGPASLLLSGNTLYGTAQDGGSSGYGTVFSLSLPVPPPLLTITSAGANVILTWPTNATGFTLQSSPALTATFTNLPSATSHYTHALTASLQYFRPKSD